MQGPKKLKSLYLIFFLLISVGQVYAQLNNCDSLRILLRSKKLSEARKVISKRLNQHPSQSICFYKTALEIYDSSIAKPSSNLLLKDSILKILDLWRIVINDCDLLNEEAKRYYQYRKNDKNYKEDICPYLRTNFLNCQISKFYPEAILSLSECFLNNNYNREETLYSCKLEESIWSYLKVNQHFSLQPEWEIFKNRVRYALFSCPFISCDKIDSLFFSELESQDLKQIKRLNSILAQKNCVSNKLYAATLEKILDAEPSFNGLYQFAIINKIRGLTSESYTYYIKAEKLASTKAQKSLCYLGIAELLEIQKNYEKAKDFVHIAIENDPDNQESFVFLANLFLKAETICTLNLSEKTALYILIAKNYRMGGLNADSEKYYQKSDIENLTKKGIIVIGQKTKIGCFINEEVLLTK